VQRRASRSPSPRRLQGRIRRDQRLFSKRRLARRLWTLSDRLSQLKCRLEKIEHHSVVCREGANGVLQLLLQRRLGGDQLVFALQSLWQARRVYLLGPCFHHERPYKLAISAPAHPRGVSASSLVVALPLSMSCYFMNLEGHSYIIDGRALISRSVHVDRRRNRQRLISSHYRAGIPRRDTSTHNEGNGYIHTFTKVCLATYTYTHHIHCW